jgi:hypothetical protein
MELEFHLRWGSQKSEPKIGIPNLFIGSDVKINQDSIHGYMGLGFDMSNFNEDGSSDVYTFGISIPIRMVRYRDSFT